MLQANVLVIAGYNILADQLPEYRIFVGECLKRARQEKAELIILVGGATNPKHPQKTEAEANYKILR